MLINSQYAHGPRAAVEFLESQKFDFTCDKSKDTSKHPHILENTPSTFKIAPARLLRYLPRLRDCAHHHNHETRQVSQHSRKTSIPRAEHENQGCNQVSLADGHARFLMKCTNESVTVELKTGKATTQRNCSTSLTREQARSCKAQSHQSRHR